MEDFDDVAPTIDSLYYDAKYLNSCNNAEKSCLSFIHFNIRSIKKNADKLQLCLQSLNTEFSVIGLTETWLSDNDSLLGIHNIPGYTYIGNGRTGRSGGGVGVFIKDNLKYCIRKDMKLFNENVETIFLEIVSKRDKIVIGIIYRPPGRPVRDFVNDLEPILFKISTEKKLGFLMGDFNINMLKNSTDNSSTEFQQAMNSYSFFHLINKPTRITNQSSSLIDNIFVNNFNNVVMPGIFICDVSDHLPVFAFSKLKSNETPK